jgi:hypothetical protein
LATTATAGSPVGSYPITASGAASSNYTIAYVSGALSVNAAALTITAAHTNKLYGAAVPALAATYGGLVNGDTAANLTTAPTLATTATAASSVGSYPITASGAAGSNYTIAYVSGTLSVNAAALTIAAANTNKLYGAAIPALAATYGGFVNGDTASSLTTQPSLATTATAASPVGTYPITASGAAASNYAIAYTGGTLTIQTAAAVALVTSSANPSLPGATVTFTAALSAVAPGTGVPTGTVQFVIDGAAAGSPAPLSGGNATYATAALGHGAHAVSARYAGDGNFTGATNLMASTQVVNTPPVPGAVTVTYDAISGVKLSVAALLRTASDADDDTITLASVGAASANGGTISSNGGWVFYVPTPGFTNADTFNYAISDGYSAPVTGTITLDLRTEGSPSDNLIVNILGNGSYGISGSGVPARVYQLDFTDGGQNSAWQALGDASADANGCFGFVDAGGSPQRLYRTVCP